MTCFGLSGATSAMWFFWFIQLWQLTIQEALSLYVKHFSIHTATAAYIALVAMWDYGSEVLLQSLWSLLCKNTRDKKRQKHFFYHNISVALVQQFSYSPLKESRLMSRDKEQQSFFYIVCENVSYNLEETFQFSNSSPNLLFFTSGRELLWLQLCSWCQGPPARPQR